jgi:hypothetical protein
VNSGTVLVTVIPGRGPFPSAIAKAGDNKPPAVKTVSTNTNAVPAALVPGTAVGVLRDATVLIVEDICFRSLVARRFQSWLFRFMPSSGCVLASLTYQAGNPGRCYRPHLPLCLGRSSIPAERVSRSAGVYGTNPRPSGTIVKRKRWERSSEESLQILGFPRRHLEQRRSGIGIL